MVCHSSGNHAQALALAARLRGVPAYIVMPSNAPAVKKAAVEGYGGRITFCEPILAARESTQAQVISASMISFIKGRGRLTSWRRRQGGNKNNINNAKLWRY